MEKNGHYTDCVVRNSPEDFPVTNAHAPYRVSAHADWPRIRVLQGDVPPSLSLCPRRSNILPGVDFKENQFRALEIDHPLTKGGTKSSENAEKRERERERENENASIGCDRIGPLLPWPAPLAPFAFLFY